MDTNEPNTPPPLPSSSGRFEFAAMDRPPGFGSIIDALLKKPGQIIYSLQQPGGAKIIGIMIMVAVIGPGIFGTVAGSLSGGIQLWAAPGKIMAGMFFSALICLPSLYIFACLNGAEPTFRGVAGSLASAVCLIALLLVGFAPVVWVFSQSTDSVAFMGALNLAFFAIGAYFGLRMIGAAGRFSESGGRGHIHVWALIFLVVCLQMTTALRPILGTSDTLLPTEKRFFLIHWLDVLTKPQKGVTQQ